MDGSRQRYRLYGSGLRRWTLKLNLLDEQELGTVISFIEQQGSAVFAFTDPLTGETASNCVISGNKFDATMKNELNGQATVTIEEIALSWYPQIGRGAIAQFPLTRSRMWRAITNKLESSEQIMLPDSAAGQIEWKLSYQDLTNTEVGSLSNLFASCQGGFAAFTFIDPLANLLGWSEDLTQPNWQVGLLQHTNGAIDPLGTQRASTVSNANPAAQAVQQTLGVSGDYVACFSGYFRSVAAGTVVIQRDGTQVTIAVGPVWKRAFVSGLGVSGAAQSTFSIVLAAGQTIDLWGLQVEAQPNPSAYKQTNAAIGIYEETYFENDELKITSTSLGLSSCEISLISRV